MFHDHATESDPWLPQQSTVQYKLLGLSSSANCEHQEHNNCPSSEEDLLQATLELMNGSLLRQLMTSSSTSSRVSRVRRSVAGLPPLITTSGTNPACQTCEMFGTLCFIFSIGITCIRYFLINCILTS